MGSKAIAFLGLFLAIALLFNSGVKAKDLAETSTSTEQSNGIDDAKYDHGSGYGHHGGYRHGHDGYGHHGGYDHGHGGYGHGGGHP